MANHPLQLFHVIGHDSAVAFSHRSTAASFGGGGGRLCTLGEDVESYRLGVRGCGCAAHVLLELILTNLE